MSSEMGVKGLPGDPGGLRDLDQLVEVIRGGVGNSSIDLQRRKDGRWHATVTEAEIESNGHPLSAFEGCGETADSALYNLVIMIRGKKIRRIAKGNHEEGPWLGVPRDLRFPPGTLFPTRLSLAHRWSSLEPFVKEPVGSRALHFALSSISAELSLDVSTRWRTRISEKMGEWVRTEAEKRFTAEVLRDALEFLETEKGRAYLLEQREVFFAVFQRLETEMADILTQARKAMGLG